MVGRRGDEDGQGAKRVKAIGDVDETFLEVFAGACVGAYRLNNFPFVIYQLRCGDGDVRVGVQADENRYDGDGVGAGRVAGRGGGDDGRAASERGTRGRCGRGWRPVGRARVCVGMREGAGGGRGRGTGGTTPRFGFLIEVVCIAPLENLPGCRDDRTSNFRSLDLTPLCQRGRRTTIAERRWTRRAGT